MGLTLAYDAAQERQYQARLEAGQRMAERTEHWHHRIKALVALGMTGVECVELPYRICGPTSSRIAFDKLPEAIYDAFDSAVVMGSLMHVLAESADPLVAELRIVIAEQIARDRATGIAECEAENG
jgi:hypothetical protein